VPTAPVLDAAEAARLSDMNWAEQLREQARGCGGTVVDDAGLLLTAAPVASPFVNSATRLDPRLRPADVLARTGRFYAERGHGHVIMVHATDDDDALAESALAAGYADVLNAPAMAVYDRLPERPLPDGVLLRPVVNEAGVRHFTDVAAEAWTTYGLEQETVATIFSRPQALLAPHVVAVVAHLDGRPAACALVFLSHGIGGIYWVSSTTPTRGRGLGEAVTRAVTNRAFELGARLVSLQASPMGEPIYRRMGFAELFRYRMLIAPRR
jgi:GNAT superfamily N-acetyltransferase